MTVLDVIDRDVLNAIQEDLPLSHRPFAEVAARIGVDEQDLLTRITRMKDDGILTRFGPFFDAAAMGGAFCLCAMAVPLADFEKIAELVNAHDEVAHNYQRAHALNMWFVLATETPDGIDRAADAIEAESGLAVRRFPKLQEFFVGFRVAA
jgi:DNA-binding Lrp family transcriptional regulator